MEAQSTSNQGGGWVEVTWHHFHHTPLVEAVTSPLKFKERDKTLLLYGSSFKEFVII